MKTIERPVGDRGAAYVRVSDDKQPITSQKQQIEAWLAGRGLSVTKWYIDAEGSNSRHKAKQRVDFQRMLQDVALGLWDWVIVDSQDRFGVKHEFERGKFLDAFLDVGCQLWSVSQGHLTDPGNPVAVLIGGIGSLTSRREQQEKAHRVLRGMLDAAEDGRFGGGNVPYAFDVAVYPQGTWEPEAERWRIVIEGPEQRVKVWPDGRRERYDGRRNWPSYDRSEDARLAVSIVEERVEAVRLLFGWYANEDISLSTLAKRLNIRGVKPSKGKGWTARMVKYILTNPIYTGVMAAGKHAQGDFADFRLTKAGPEVVDTEWEMNKPPPERRRSQEEWVFAREFRLPAIVEPEVWESVQEKLNRPGKERRQTARTDVCWLRRFMVCGHCGQPMRSAALTGRSKPKYYCGTWQDTRLGKENPAGCRRHPVEHELAERIVNQYLQEKQEGYDLMTEEHARRIRHLEGEVEDRRQEIERIHTRMREFVRQSIGTGNTSPFLREMFEQEKDHSQTWEPGPEDVLYRFGLSWLVDLYNITFERKQADVSDQIARMEKDLEEQVLAFGKLRSPRAQEIAAKHIEGLEAELEKLKVQQEPLMEKLEEVHLNLVKVKFLLQKAREQMAGSNNRQKTESLGKLVSQIVCRFRNTDGKGPHPSSVLESVQIIPHGGEAWTVEMLEEVCEDGNQRTSAGIETLTPRPALSVALMGRVFDRGEVDQIRTGA